MPTFLCLVAPNLDYLTFLNMSRGSIDVDIQII